MDNIIGKYRKDETQREDSVSRYENSTDVTGDENNNVPEHYDGKSLSDVFGTNERPVDRRESFIETRNYLRQVRDYKRRVELLEERIKYSQAAGTGTTALEADLDFAKHLLNVKVAEVINEISKIGQVNQEAVLIRRYIDLISWEEIAEKLDFRMRTVLKLHGYGLPALEKVLLEDGLITMEIESEVQAEDPDKVVVGDEV